MSVRRWPRRLAAPRGPWLHLLVARELADAVPPAPPGFLVARLDGRRCPTAPALFGELARAFTFPAYFGGTWDGVEDCLADLEWRSARGYWLVIAPADRLLADEPDAYPTLVAVLDAVGRAWGTGQTGHPGRPPRPFHTILVVSPDALSARDWQARPLGRERPSPRRRRA